jgi:DNA polymerase-1
MLFHELSIVLIRPDKDYAQLVEEHIYLYKPAYMGNGVDVLGIPEVLAKFDIENVDQVRDFLGLQGDAVDNIPGIPGVGAKTAVKLLKEYGSVENIVANADQLKGALQKKVTEFGEQGIFSKKLATIVLDVPLEFVEEELLCSAPDETVLRPIFDELEFRTMANRVFQQEVAGAPTKSKGDTNQLGLFGGGSSEEEQPPMAIAEMKSLENTEHQYHLVDTKEKREKLISALAQQTEYCFDTETTGLEVVEAKLVGMAFSYKVGEAWYVPTPADDVEANAIALEFKAVLENAEVVIIGQNLKYDIQIMRNYDVHINGNIFDTMLAHYLIDPETPHKMDVLAENYLGYRAVPIEDLIGKKGVKQGNMRDVPVERVVEYAGEDADITLQLKYKLEEEIKERKLEKLLHEVEEPLSFVLANMEYTGVSINEEALAEMSKELTDLAAKAQQEIYDIAGTEFNIASPKQLGEVLFDRMKLIDNPKKTKTGQYATGEDILSKLANEHEIADKILEFREYQKLKNTYVDALPKLVSPVDNRIHTDYRQAVAATGRLSSNNPNLQNIPIRTEKGREIRKAFIPVSDEFVMLSADYSQIELRIMAAFSKDESMIAAFKEGRDIHTTTASKVFKVPIEEVEPDMRRRAKEVNFGIIYGISAFGLSQNLSIPRSEAAEIINAYFEEFPAVKTYMDNCKEEARKNEYVETILGRRRFLRDINSRNQTVRGFAERNAVNAPIQGSAADMIKVAMINIHEWMMKEKLKSRMIMQVHDELVFEAHKDELELLKTKVEDLMKNAMNLGVPMDVGIGQGKNWLEAH